jgi:hypothetical protein
MSVALAVINEAYRDGVFCKGPGHPSGLLHCMRVWMWWPS